MRKVRAIRCFSGRSSTTAAAARGEDGGEDGPLQEEGAGSRSRPHQAALVEVTLVS